MDLNSREATIVLEAGETVLCTFTNAEVADDCNVNGDGQIDRDDSTLILAARNTLASGADDPRDPNGDGMINVLDARLCVLQCTHARCAP